MPHDSPALPPIAHETIPFDALCGLSSSLALDDGDRRQPLRWNRDAEASGERRRVLCTGLDRDASDANTGRARLWQLAEQTPHLDWLLLTDDPARLGERVPDTWQGGYAPNIWVGVRATNQAETDARVPLLLDLPAPVRFLWCEPLRDRIDLTAHLPGFDARVCDCPCHSNPGICHVKPCCRDGYRYTPRPPGLHWVIAGGDAAPDAAPMHPDHLDALREQCWRAQVKFYFTQWGRWGPAYRFPLYRQVFRQKIRLKGTDSRFYRSMVRLRDGETLDNSYYKEIPTLPHPAPHEDD